MGENELEIKFLNFKNALKECKKYKSKLVKDIYDVMLSEIKKSYNKYIKNTGSNITKETFSNFLKEMITSIETFLKKEKNYKSRYKDSRKKAVLSLYNFAINIYEMKDNNIKIENIKKTTIKSYKSITNAFSLVKSKINIKDLPNPFNKLGECNIYVCILNGTGILKSLKSEKISFGEGAYLLYNLNISLPYVGTATVHAFVEPLKAVGKVLGNVAGLGNISSLGDFLLEKDFQNLISNLY